MDPRILTGRPRPWMILFVLVFVTLACGTFSKPTATPTPGPAATTLPDFQLTADYQAVVATQLSATETALEALQVQQVQIQPTLQALFADQCEFSADQSAGGAFLQNLNIDLWPEYDRPSMLIIYRMTLSDILSLPVALSFRIPARAGEPNAVAVRESDGNLINAEYTRNVDGDWATIQFTATTPFAQLEYYDPGLTRSGFSRHFEFQWMSDYSIADLLIRVRPTQKITSLQITPRMAGPGLASDGSLYFCDHAGPVEVDTPFSFGIDYDSNDGP